MQPDPSGAPQFRIIRLPNWAAVLIGAGVLATTLALLALAATAALILMPILLLAGLGYGWWFRRKLSRQAAQQGWPEAAKPGSRDGDIIDAEFVILEPEQSDPPNMRRIEKGDTSRAAD